MAKNEFLPFGIADGANVLSNDEYGNLSARTNGFSSGVAKSQELNKVWRQTSVIASVVAQFIAETNNQDVLDNGNTEALQKGLLNALRATVGSNIPVASQTVSGITKLSNSTNSNSEVDAATPKAVKTAYDLANTASQNAANANNNAKGGLEKSKNGADIPVPKQFVKNLGLLGTVDLANNAVPNSRKINNKPLTGDITLLAGDVYAYPSPAYSDVLPDDNYIGPFLGGPSVGWAKGVSIGSSGGDVGQIWIDSGATLHTRFLNKGKGATQQRIVSIPIGATIEWQSEAAIPFGFMENNGREFNKSQYPELLKVFPSGRLPDDRGLFKRGLDTMGGISRGLDPGRKLGTVQNDAIRNITGGFGSPTTEEGNFGDGAFSVKVGYGGRKAGAGGNYVSYRFDASRVVPTANENRPVNKSVIYITRVF